MKHSDKSSKSTAHDSPSISDRITSLYKTMGWKPLFFDSDEHLFFPEDKSKQSIFGLIEQGNKTADIATKLINKFESRDFACANRAKSIPKNATIRKEYVKCRKETCEEKHGPYYYAYWKDPETKQLKKKYIGTRMPKTQEKLNNNSISNNNKNSNESNKVSYP
jgi:hypothetical protein